MTSLTDTRTFNDISEWLIYHGFFKKGKNSKQTPQHPFEQLVADTDQNLSHYFIEEFPFFQEIQKPDKCSFLFLKRGAGKSANRMMIGSQCDVSLRNNTGRRLAVHYTDFHELIQKDNVALADHVNAILCEAVPRLYSVLGQTEDNLIKELPEEYCKDFAWFITRYSQRLSSRSIERQILEISNKKEKQELIKNILLKPLANVVGTVTEKAIPGSELLLKPVLTLLNADTGRKDDLQEIDHSPLDVMARFAEIARRLKIDHIYILVDRIDEYGHIYGFEQAAQMLKPLIATIPLLEMSPFAFKFFLPLEIRDTLKTHLRSDKFDTYSYEWESGELKKMLQARLSSATNEEEFTSEEERKSFNRLFLSNIRRDEDELLGEMIQFANRSPRNLLKLGKWIFDEHTRSAPFYEFISRETYEDALAAFAAEQMEQRAVDEPSIEELRELDLTNHHTLENLLERDIGTKKPPSEIVRKWEENDQFVATHFSLTDIVFSLNQPKLQAMEAARQWEENGLISIHYKVIDESLKRYLFAENKKEENMLGNRSPPLTRKCSIGPCARPQGAMLRGG